MPRSRIVVTLLSLVGAVAACLLVLPPAQARDTLPTPFGQDPIVPGQPYTGDFPDPWIMRIGPRYYAYSTPSYNLTLPMLMSADLRTWTTRPAAPDNPAGDAMLQP